MPFTKEDLSDTPIYFERENTVSAIVGPCTARAWTGNKIPLDGRQYCCGAIVIFKNGERHRASIRIDTTTFDFLIRGSVYIVIDDVWYKWNEPELLDKLKTTSEEVFPFYWQTDRPLDYHQPGPYPMKWPDNKDWDK